MLAYISNKIFCFFQEKPLVGIVSGTVTGLISHDIVGMIGTIAGTTVAVLSALVWLARFYDTYKPRCIKMYIKIKPYIMKAKNCFLWVLMTFVLSFAGCKARQVLNTKSNLESHTDSASSQISKVIASSQKLASNVDTGSHTKMQRMTLTADFSPAQQSDAPLESTDAQEALVALFGRRLNKLTIELDKLSHQKNGRSEFTSSTNESDSTGKKKAEAHTGTVITASQKQTTTKPNYTWILYVGLVIFIGVMIWSAYVRTKYGRLLNGLPVFKAPAPPAKN